MGIASAREKHIRDELYFNQKYSLDQIYQIYLEIMKRQYFIDHGTVVCRKTISNQLSAIANADSWLSFEDGLYYKREPKCIFARLHDWLIKLTERVKEWVRLLTLTLKYKRKG